jgi:hypothetical protein
LSNVQDAENTVSLRNASISQPPPKVEPKLLAAAVVVDRYLQLRTRLGQNSLEDLRLEKIAVQVCI